MKKGSAAVVFVVAIIILGAVGLLFFAGRSLLSIGSSFQSFVRWNTNTEECVYYTAIFDSSHSIVVDDGYCSLRTYTREPKTIASVDQQLLGAGTNGALEKGIGEICTSASECGLACQGYPSSYTPRCIDGGNGKVCFCGQDSGVYSAVCARDSDCASGQFCISGVCTLPNDGTSGNPTPVNNDTICHVIDCTKRCSDGTAANTCSQQAPLYCQNDGTLISYSGICGCPSGQRADFNARTCCTPPSCYNCQAGETNTQKCSDGTTVTLATCGTDGTWQRTNAVCPVSKPSFALFWIVGGIIALLLIVGGIIIAAYKR